MEKYKKYYGVMLFAAVALACVLAAYYAITPQITEHANSDNNLQEKKTALEGKQAERGRVISKLKQLKDSIATSQKKIYSPVESDLGNDTLFFTLYEKDKTVLVTNMSLRLYAHTAPVEEEETPPAAAAADVNLQ